MLESNEVVITGIGLVTPLGMTTEENWHHVCDGRSGLSLFLHPRADQLTSRVVGQVPDAAHHAALHIPAKDIRKMERFSQYAVLAARQAMLDAGLTTTLPAERDRCGVYLGIGVGGLETFIDVGRTFDEGGAAKISPFMLPKAISNEAASWISIYWNLTGPMLTVVNACSSSADAVGLGYRLIRDGYADYMLVGGTESCITPESIAAFGTMRTLSTWQGEPHAASRPFDKKRTGFVMGEGAGILLLERKSSAIARQARIYASVVGYAATADAYHIIAMHPEARGAQKAMEAALSDARIRPEQVGYINAHGTGTPMNDAAESMAIKKVFGAHADPTKENHLVVSSTKSMTGHLLGAAGGVEIAYTALALYHQKVPPTLNLTDPDPLCDLDYVPHVARKHTFEYALSNSFGFGGANAVVVLKK